VGLLSITHDARTDLVIADTVGSVTTGRTYDNVGNLSELTYRYGGTVIFQTSYTRDSLSRILSQTETGQGVTIDLPPFYVPT